MKIETFLLHQLLMMQIYIIFTKNKMEYNCFLMLVLKFVEIMYDGGVKACIAYTMMKRMNYDCIRQSWFHENIDESVDFRSDQIELFMLYELN
jgi:hypothetical protein